MSEQLQAMEDRAVAAEKVIADALKYWRDTYACTDRVTIMPSILKSVDLTAAREMMRKAEESDKLKEQVEGLQSQLAEADFGFGGWEATKRELQREADTLRRQLAEAELLVEKLRTGIINAYGRMAVWNDDINADVMPVQDDLAVEALKQLLKESRTSAAALSAYRREVLEEVAKLLDHDADHAAECSKQAHAKGDADDATRYEYRAMNLCRVAAKIRAMGEGK